MTFCSSCSSAIPHKYIASFHRENLRYLVRECAGYEQNALLVAHAGELREQQRDRVRAHHQASSKRRDDFLEEPGDPAIAYHGKMDASETAAAIRNGGLQMKCAWWLPRLRSVSASTKLAFARSFIFRCQSPSSSTTRKPDAPAATANLRIACCFGSVGTPPCLRTSSTKFRIQRRRTVPGSAIAMWSASRNRSAAGIDRFACTLARPRSGLNATAATYAAERRNG